jgi:hypothetical protein
MATEDRKRIRCKCGLIQFVNKTQVCVRCRQSYSAQPVSEAATPVVAKQPPVDPMPGQKVFDFSMWIGFVLWDIRRRQGLSQADLARRLHCQRTWLTKIESRQTIPTMSESFPRLCAGLNVTPWYVVRMAEFLVWGQ